MRAFIIRPFGTKKGIDFDRVEAELIGPALTECKVTGRTTGEILEAGNIRTDMFQQLLVADLVIADISTNNANAFYELGIRHALRDRHTFLLRSRTIALPAEPKPEEPDEVPFDLRTDRYLAYDPSNPAATLPALIDGLQQTLAGDRHDSPVFLSLPNLTVQERSCFTPVPLEFGEEVERAAAAKDPAKLALLSLEVMGFTWETEGLRLVGRAQFEANHGEGAKSTWEAVRDIDAHDKEANLRLGTIYQRLGDLTNSNLCLDRVTALPAVTPGDLAEAYALRGRNQKQLWQDDWRRETPEKLREHALASPLLLQAYQEYSKAFQQDLNAHYPGLNALGLLTVLLELAGQYPDAWKARFEDDARGESELAGLRQQQQELGAAVGLCLKATKARGGIADSWLLVSEADYRLLTSTRPTSVAYAYQGIVNQITDFMKEAVRRQLRIYRDLGVLHDNVAAALQVIGENAADGGLALGQKQRAQLERVIVFTGHRVDAPGRRSPRFPAACENKARDAIRQAVVKVQTLTAGEVLGLAGAASGGDILFHEVCRELNIPTKICLALPPDAYIAASVKPANADWEQRFYKIGAGAKEVPVLAEGNELPRWLRLKPGYDIWQRNNLWELSQALVLGAAHTTLLALWDGKEGDGPGGTEHMMGIGRQRHANIEILNTREIFGLPG